VDHKGKGEEKVEQKRKELIFIGGVELVDLDDYEVPDIRLHYDSNYTDDNDVLNPTGMDVGDNAALCSQIIDPNLGLATEPLPVVVAV
jgi:hypothetical protein